MDALVMSFLVSGDTFLANDEAMSFHSHETYNFNCRENVPEDYGSVSLYETRNINKLNPVLKKTKRAKRAVINRGHLLTLEAKFQIDPKPSQQIRNELAHILKLPERSILVWFQNRRTKARANGELPAVNSKPKSSNSAWPSVSTTASTNTSEIPSVPASIFTTSPFINQSQYYNQSCFNGDFSPLSSSQPTYSELNSISYSHPYINFGKPNSFGESSFIPLNYSQFHPNCPSLYHSSSLDSSTSSAAPI